jgi:hypothetical protein
MNETETVIVDDRAWIGWTKLPPTVQAHVLDRLRPLAGRPTEDWPPAGVERWRSDDLYVLTVSVGSDDLLVFCYPRGEQVHIDSMLLKEAFDRRVNANGAASA